VSGLPKTRVPETRDGQTNSHLTVRPTVLGVLGGDPVVGATFCVHEKYCDSPLRVPATQRGVITAG
jgi:hypothetical protein